MFKKFAYIVVIAFLLFVLIGLFLPRHVHVERQIDIARPAATVFTLLNSYRSFLAWSPWADRDPDASYELSGPDAGPGARLSWSGDPRLVGSGWQEIVESQPYTLNRMALDFGQQGTADTYFRLLETKEGVNLTWGFDTDLLAGQGWFGGILARYFGLFFDRWIGGDYEQGLQRLKVYAEALPEADFAGLEVERVRAEPRDVLWVPIPTERGRPGLAAAYREMTAFMAAHGIERDGQPLTVTRSIGDGGWAMEAALPIVLPEEPPEPAGAVRFGRSPAGEAIRAQHKGPHETLSATYERLAAWLAAHGLEEGAASWEQYVSDPRQVSAEELLTEVYVLVEEPR